MTVMSWSEAGLGNDLKDGSATDTQKRDQLPRGRTFLRVFRHSGFVVAVSAGLISGCLASGIVYVLDHRLIANEKRYEALQIALLTAEKQAAMERERADRLKAAIVWREIDARTAACLQNGLGDAPRDFEILSIAGDPEAGGVADQLQEILEATGRRVRRSQIFAAYGVGEYYLYGRRPDIARAGVRLLNDCGLASRQTQTRIDAAGIVGLAPPGFSEADAVQIFVNTKKKERSP